MEMTYKVLLHEADYRAIYENMRQDGTLWTAWPDIDPDEWTPEIVVRLMSRPDVLVLGGAVDGVPAGFMTLQAVSRRTMTAEIGVAVAGRAVPALPLAFGYRHDGAPVPQAQRATGQFGRSAGHAHAGRRHAGRHDKPCAALVPADDQGR